MTIGEVFDVTLAAAKAGAEWAWAAIYRDLAGPVAGYVASRGAADADDLVSETFLHVARGIHGFEGDEAAFRSWVFVIAHRRLQDQRRAAGSRPRTVAVPVDDPTVSPPIADDDVEGSVISSLSWAQMLELLNTLTDDQRDVILLRIVGEQSLEATAAALGKRVGSIKALQHRALDALRKKLPERP